MWCALIYSCENRSRGCSVVSSFRILVDYMVKVRVAATQSRFSEFLLGLCMSGHVLRPMGGEHYLLSSRRRNDPRGPASSRGAEPAVIFRVVRCCFSYVIHDNIVWCSLPL